MVPPSPERRRIVRGMPVLERGWKVEVVRSFIEVGEVVWWMFWEGISCPGVEFRRAVRKGERVWE